MLLVCILDCYRFIWASLTETGKWVRHLAETSHFNYIHVTFCYFYTLTIFILRTWHFDENTNIGVRRDCGAIQWREKSCGSVVVKITWQWLIFSGLAPAEDGLEELLALLWGMLTILWVAPVSLWPQWWQFLGLWRGLHFKQQQMKMSQHKD